MRKKDKMEEQVSQDFAERGLQYTREQFEQLLEQTEDYVRENPLRALGYAVLAGLVIDRLPVCRLTGGLTRLALMALKPAILIYGATKIYQAVQQEEF
ncbi:MAG: hypothetical protein ACXWAX_11370 [Chthoniobacterales bacterium]